MEILGIGMPELIFVVIIALLIMGPKDMQKAGKTIGKFLRDIITSDGWKIFQQTSRDLRNLPNRLIREANEDLNQVNKEIRNAASIPDPTRANPANSRPQPQPYSATPPAKLGGENTISPEPQAKNNSESETPNNA